MLHTTSTMVATLAATLRHTSMSSEVIVRLFAMHPAMLDLREPHKLIHEHHVDLAFQRRCHRQRLVYLFSAQCDARAHPIVLLTNALYLARRQSLHEPS